MLETLIGLGIMVGGFLASMKVGFRFTKYINPTRDRSDPIEVMFAFVFGFLFIVLGICLTIWMYGLGSLIINIIDK